MGVLADEHLNAARVKIELGVFRRRAALNVVDLASLLGDNQGMLELAHSFRVHPEVRLDRHIHCGVFRHVDKRATGPDCSVECGELVVTWWDR